VKAYNLSTEQHPDLISVFDELPTFVYSPHGSWEGDCSATLYYVLMYLIVVPASGGLLYPNHAANRPVGSPSVVSKVSF